MDIVVLQHEAFEGPALIADWARERGHALSICHVYRGDDLPALDSTDWIVAMGGAMSVNDEERLPWIVVEKALLRRAIEARKRVLGVCLGAQMIASALGARVHRNAEREIGWWPLQVLETGRALLPDADPTVLHWHGETFDLPCGSTLLASTSACANQAFSIGERVVGLQFHLESTRQSVRDLVAACADELEPDAKWVQSREQVLGGGFFEANRALLWSLLDSVERS